MTGTVDATDTRPEPPGEPLVHVRRLGADEHPLVRAHLARLDAATLRLRFGNAVNGDFLDRYAALAVGPEALVKGLFVDGELRGLAELRFLTGSHDEAEGAFSIEPAFQNRGYGTRLFGQLVAASRNRGVRRLFLTCLRENRRMQAIARRHGGEVSFEAGDATAELRRPHADAESLATEWTGESQAFAFALIESRREHVRVFAEAVRRSLMGILPFALTR